jgi:hypothetical protein
LIVEETDDSPNNFGLHDDLISAMHKPKQIQRKTTAIKSNNLLLPGLFMVPTNLPSEAASHSEQFIIAIPPSIFQSVMIGKIMRQPLCRGSKPPNYRNIPAGNQHISTEFC